VRFFVAVKLPLVSTRLTSMDPLQRYQQDVESGAISADDAQLAVACHLKKLYEQIVQSENIRLHPAARLWRRLLGREQPSSCIKGLYLWGGVGRGKTYLMDIFYDSLPGKAKLRTHFHRFMQRIHRDLAAHQGQKNPLDLIAEQIAKEARILCFDEFFVRDIGDAMILGSLLDALFKRQVVLVATSNIVPDQLYEEGLQRERFLPAIQLIKEHTETIEIQSGVDYRLRSLTQATLYHCPINEQTDALLLAFFYKLAPDPSTIKEGEVVEILERSIDSRYFADDVVWFSFEQICEGPRSAFDYVELAKMYHAVILAEVPQLTEASNDSARRFINLVDELYDRRVKLIISAQVPISDLYRGQKLAFEFERTQSRLIEMQSQQYLSDQHLA